jgi:hypothetical protein
VPQKAIRELGIAVLVVFEMPIITVVMAIITVVMAIIMGAAGITVAIGAMA